MTSLRADAVVVGTGAGGAAAAAELAAGGLDVVVLEEGARHDYRTFTARPRDMTLRLYRDAGQLATIGTPPIVLPLGRAVGGTTLINSGTCFRTPAHVLERWALEDGVPAIDDAVFDHVEEPPDQAALATPGAGPLHRERMLAVRSTATFGVVVADSATGSVREVGGRLLIRYDLHPGDAERLRRGFELLADIWWAAGAREIIVPLVGVPVLRGGDSAPLRRARVRPRDVKAMAFHPLGTARAGADPARAVLGPDLQVHGVRGLYVADGSAVPSSPQVNPQVTIMALAVRLGRALAGVREGAFARMGG